MNFFTFRLSRHCVSELGALATQCRINQSFALAFDTKFSRPDAVFLDLMTGQHGQPVIKSGSRT
jgi:hypothetical protein